MIDDPVRLIDSGGSELLRVLLSAAHEERPQPVAIQRTLTAVAAGAALVATGTSASSASAALGTASLGSAKGAASAVPVLVVKWLGIGLLTGLAGVSVAYRASAPRAQSPNVQVSSMPAPAPTSPRTPRRAPATQELAEIPPVAAPAPVAPPRLAASTPAAAWPDPGPSLAAEVAALDAARQALAAGDSAHALDLLSRYEARFPEARMLPEALFLRLEALLRAGDQASAAAVARRILRVFPTSPHAARARAVLGLDKE